MYTSKDVLDFVPQRGYKIEFTKYSYDYKCKRPDWDCEIITGNSGKIDKKLLKNTSYH